MVVICSDARTEHVSHYETYQPFIFRMLSHKAWHHLSIINTGQLKKLLKLLYLQRQFVYTRADHRDAYYSYFMMFYYLKSLTSAFH